MRQKIANPLLLLAATVLTSCGILNPDSDSLGGLLMNTVTGGLGLSDNEDSKTDSTTAAQKALSRIYETGRPGLLASVPKMGQTMVMILEQENGPYQTFRGTNNTTVTMRSGIVNATRGIGVDLMGQGLSQPESTLFKTGSFPKEYARVQRHLDGENELLSAEFLCVTERKERQTLTIVDRKYATTLFEETCRYSRRIFINRYWVGASDGTIWQSQQAVSQVSGHIILQRIEPR